LVQEPTEPNDDPSIPNDTRLIHRIRKDAVFRSPDGRVVRPNNGAFRPRRGERLSVYVESVLLAHGLTVEIVLDGHEDGYVLVAITAGDVRALGLGVVADPDESDGDRGLAHALLTGHLTGHVRDELVIHCERIGWK